MRISRGLRLAILSGFTAFLASCSNGSGPREQPQPLSGNYSGTAQGTEAGTPFTGAPITLTIQQNGENLTGVWQTAGGFGTLSGTTDLDVGNQHLDFTLTQTSPCPGSFTGTAIQSAHGGSTIYNDIFGSYSGAYCGGTVVVDQFHISNP